MASCKYTGGLLTILLSGVLLEFINLIFYKKCRRAQMISEKITPPPPKLWLLYTLIKGNL